MLVVTVAVWSALAAVCLRLLSNAGRLRPADLLIAALAGLGWLAIAVSLVFGRFWVPYPTQHVDIAARSAADGGPRRPAPGHLPTPGNRFEPVQAHPAPPPAAALTDTGTSPARLQATPDAGAAGHPPARLPAEPAPIPAPAVRVAAPAPEPATPQQHLLATIAEPGPGGADWTVLVGWSDATAWPQRGTVLSTTLHGVVSGLSEQAYVYLPPSYFDPVQHQDPPAQGQRDLPLTVVFSGYPGDADRLITHLHYPDVTLTGIQDRTITPTVLVMLSPSVDYPWDTECTDIPDGPAAFTFYARDVPDAVAAQFHLQPDSYAVVGDSTGGYCAAKLESVDPARFAVAASLSGYYHPATDPTTRGEFANTAVREHNDLGWRLQHLPSPAVSLLLATATDETGDDGWTTNQQWMGLIHPPMKARELVLDHGGHNFASWNREIPYALSWISAQLPRSDVVAEPTPLGATIANSPRSAGIGSIPADTAHADYVGGANPTVPEPRDQGRLGRTRPESATPLAEPGRPPPGPEADRSSTSADLTARQRVESRH
ncbi:MAG TPA: alpha/beta hydrolase-fold protein [Sporichthyaceae bacterium]|nr:alpha/beta hydrolase-fold protein [Sporichthyaceae bacterium]